MNKKYQVYYRTSNDKYFMFETDDISDIDERVEYYLRRFVIGIDNFYDDVEILLYEEDTLIQSVIKYCKYSYM